MTASCHYAADYRSARRQFLDAAGAAGARIRSYPNPQPGPSGEALATDIAWVGPPESERVLMTMSATHGVEGFCGSGAQIGSFASGLAKELPCGTALVAVHAINPYGFAWLRRVTEENVDLNRNFVDFAQELPTNPEYELLADAICPPRWDDATRAAAQVRLEAFGRERGAHALQKAISGGQYCRADGIFYGGVGPSWARRTLERLLDEELPKVRHLAVVDFHTGLGPYGYGEPIVLDAPGSAGFERARDWWGDEITSPASGSSSSPTLHGVNLEGIARALPQAAVTGIGLEFGTIALHDVIDAVRGDNWLHLHGRLDSTEGFAIKRQIRDAFYCDADDWKAMVLEQGIARQRQALAGLAQS
jgi:hypothetical protein